MDQLPLLPQSITGAIGLIAAIAFAIYAGVTKFQNNSGVLRKQINDDYKERNDQLNKRIVELQEGINLMGREVSEVRGQLIEKDKHIESLTNLIQGRNPEMLQVLQEIRDFMRDLHVTMSDSQKELTYQTGILEKKKPGSNYKPKKK